MQSPLYFTFVGFPDPPRAELVYGKMKRGLVSREFGAIYVDRVAVARTGCKVRGRTDEPTFGFGKKCNLMKSLSIEMKSL